MDNSLLKEIIIFQDNQKNFTDILVYFNSKIGVVQKFMKNHINNTERYNKMAVSK